MEHSTLDDLELQILKAHIRGDRETLERLQEQYRSRGVERVSPPPQIRHEASRQSASRSTPSHPMRRRIVLTQRAREAISGFWHGETSRDGSPHDLETGGPLFGILAGPSIFIDDAVEISNAERGRYSLRWNRDDMAYLEKVYRRPVVGDWHLHPAQPVPTPSDQDRAGWGKLSGETGDAWAGIILGDNGSASWPMKAWITKFNGGKPRTYPVPLLDEE